MKKQSQRILDAAEVLRKSQADGRAWADIAREMLEAADREAPLWPSDELVRINRQVLHLNPSKPGDQMFERTREALRATMLADPINKAAIAYRDIMSVPPTEAFYRDTVTARLAIRKAVDEAGL